MRRFVVGGTVFLALLAVAFHAVSQADIVTVDFEDLGVAPGTELVTQPGEGVTSHGFNYTPGPNNSSGFNDLHIANEFAHIPPPPSNSTTLGGSHDDVVLTHAQGWAFDLISFDFSGYANEGLLTVTGIRLDGSEIVEEFNPDGLTDTLETFPLDSKWTNLVSVTWEHTAGFEGLFALDNIIVEPIDTLFFDGFESGDISAWSTSEP